MIKSSRSIVAAHGEWNHDRRSRAAQKVAQDEDLRLPRCFIK
jgi:hypothetical protein